MVRNGSSAWNISPEDRETLYDGVVSSLYDQASHSWTPHWPRVNYLVSEMTEDEAGSSLIGPDLSRYSPLIGWNLTMMVPRSMP